MNKPSASFLRAKNARDALTPVDSVSAAEFDLCQQKSRPCVGDRTTSADDALTDDELEQAISEIGQRFVEAAERAVKSNCFGDMGEASRLWSIQKHLISLRSPEWKTRREKELGID